MRVWPGGFAVYVRMSAEDVLLELSCSYTISLLIGATCVGYWDHHWAGWPKFGVRQTIRSRLN
eukprot:scaffold1804_cov134-Skeletonema_marinoi.AAC.4